MNTTATSPLFRRSAAKAPLLGVALLAAVLATAAAPASVTAGHDGPDRSGNAASGQGYNLHLIGQHSGYLAELHFYGARAVGL